MTRRSCLLLAPTAWALAGCAFFAPLPEGPDRRTAVAVDEAVLHTAARDAEALPGVSCVDVTLEKAGNPYTLTGDPVVDVEATTSGAAAREALTRDLGEHFWDAGTLDLFTLRLVVVAPDGASDLGAVLRGTAGLVSDDELEAAFGPRTPATSTVPPPDPGDPECT